MNKLFRIILILCALILAVSCVGCKEQVKEKEVLQFDGMLASVDEASWMETSDIILKGRVLEKKEPYFTNPDNEVFCEDGSPATNAYVTEYIVAVDELYKGEWSEETISVKTYNRIGLTVEQALYGEDEDYIIESSIPDTEMQLGECIVGLHYFDTATISFCDTPCYEITYGRAGYFLEQEDGTYMNQSDGNQFTIDPQTLPDKIAALDE